MHLKQFGTAGEKEVVSLVRCPNCEKQLMTLPESYPLVDVQCTACHFRAQIKTTSSNPYKKHIIKGAGWDILNKVLKSGYLMPPLIVNYKWMEGGKQHQEIRFFPFVSKHNLQVRVAHIRSQNRVYSMFDYNLVDLPSITLYSKSTE